MSAGPDRTPDTGHGPQGAAGYLTAREAAARFGVNERTIRRAITRGELLAVKRHGAFAIDSASLDAWRARRDDSPSPDAFGRAPRHRGELPEPVASLIGRERELATATRMLRREDVRLLTLSGAGGIGKTRLALAAAADLATDFDDGIHLVSLAEVLEAELVATAIAEHLDLPETGSAELWPALVAALREARALMVLDSFEHVLAAAPLVSELLRSCPRLKILVTSRSLLRIGGEQALPVPPLELPAPGHDPSLAQAEASPAVRLFVDRARSTAPDFALTVANAPAVAAICQRLAGLPLAIELAASQVTVLPPGALLARIEAQLPLPLDGPRDAPDRQRTMTNAIAWSYALLSPDARRLFRRIGVFVGGFPLEAAVAVGGSVAGDAPRDTLATLAASVEASLVQRAAGDEARFTMLEPIRAFALERLELEGELEATCDACADWCLALAERSPRAGSLPGGERHLAWLDAEHANVRRALEWLYRRQDADRLPRLAIALGDYWYERNHYREGRLWTERALVVGADLAPGLRGQVLARLGLFRGILGDDEPAREAAAAGIALLREAGDGTSLTHALLWQGAIALQRGRYDDAERSLEEVLARAATIPDASLAAAMSARAMSNLGAVAHARGDLDGASRRHGEALRRCREQGYLLGVARSLCDLADVAREREDFATSLAYFRECLSVQGDRSDIRIVIDALAGAALAASAWGQGRQAARLLGAATGLEEGFGVPTFMPIDRTAHERASRATRLLLDGRAFDRHFAAGGQLTLPEAIAEMMACVPPASVTPGGTLTPRERDVLRLLAAGRRDREIADALFISVRTVEGHVTRIFAKLGVSTRVEAAHAAAALGLGGPER